MLRSDILIIGTSLLAPEIRRERGYQYNDDDLHSDDFTTYNEIRITYGFVQIDAWTCLPRLFDLTLSID